MYSSILSEQSPMRISWCRVDYNVPGKEFCMYLFFQNLKGRHSSYCIFTLAMITSIFLNAGDHHATKQNNRGDNRGGPVQKASC